ncbi:MAG: amidohydrolase family protein, partial [Candidatus Limnocylindria bacterium]
SVLIRGGTLLTTPDGMRGVRGDLLVLGSRIEEVGRVEARGDSEVIDASGCYVMPGIVQTHVHLVQTLMRGAAEDLPLLDWLRRRIWPLEAAHDEASLRASARLGLHELLTTGTTCVLDMGTSHGGDAVAEELATSGIRARFGQAMMDAGEGVPARLLETTRASLDASAGLRKRWDGYGGGRLGYAYAPRFALSCTRELLEEVAALSRMTGTLVHTHSNESADERALIEGATGRAPVAYLDEVSLLSERAVVAHGVHLDGAEIRILADTGTTVAHCPSSNLKLGSGIADVPRLRAARVNVGLGADGAACSNRLDGFEEARLAALLARSHGGATALSAADVLLMATRDGARALGIGDVGALQAGFRADIAILDAERLAPGGDPATRIVFGGGSRAVRDVMVNGEILIRNRRPTRYDPGEVLVLANEARSALTARATVS